MKFARRGLLAITVLAMCAAAADAQQADSIDALIERVTTPPTAPPPNLTSTEKTALKSALASARAGDRARFDSAFALINDIDAKRIATWALVDADGEDMSFFELDQARRDLAGWPRESRRMTLAEQKLADSGLSPQGIVDFFGPDIPTTGEGVLALATAYQAMGREADARALVVNCWRNMIFEADPQAQILARFGQWLSPDDHAKRADLLLYGPQGPAAQAIVNLLPPDQKAVAQARMALRSGARNADDLVSNLPADLQKDGGLIFERVSAARRAGRTTTAFSLARNLPPAPGFDDGDRRIYGERRRLFVLAMQAQDYDAAYYSMAGGGFGPGVNKAEADFFAGWLALTKRDDPATALKYFEGVRQAGTSPLTQGRALYWLGRAAEAAGDSAGAQAYYQEGAQYIGAFYGQLAAEKAGVKTLTLPPEPQPTDADKARFESRPQIRAMRILASIDEIDLFKSFARDVDDNLPSAEEYALMMDMCRDVGQPFTAMMAGRAAAQRGFLLPERMYPLRAVPNVPGAPDPAFVMAITRQESSFDPKIRSSADARGMMMLLPSTAKLVARRLGVPYEAAKLYDADYNMQLGTYHLGELMNQESGSFLLTAVGYNAGPARPAQWTPYCGDPRTYSTDPVDFIECVPFTETRDYMMRVMENVQIYRARLNGGSAPLTLSADLKRGGYNAVAAN